MSTFFTKLFFKTFAHDWFLLIPFWFNDTNDIGPMFFLFYATFVFVAVVVDPVAAPFVGCF
jgi:hypothetical protein